MTLPQESARYSLRTQMAVVFAALVVVLSVLLSLSFGEVHKRRIQRDVSAALQVVASNAGELLAQGLMERSREVQVLASAPSIWEHGLDSPEVTQVLSRSQAMHPNSLWIGVADPNGRVRAATQGLLQGQDVSQRPWFKAGLESLYVGDVHPAVLLSSLLPPSAKGEPHRFVDFAAPIRIQGKVAGVLAIHGSWDWTHEVIQGLMPANAAEQQLELYVFDQGGHLIYAPEGEKSPLWKAGQKLPPNLLQPGSISRQQAAVVRWEDGHRYLTTAMRLPARNAESDLGWHIVARMPSDIAFAEAEESVMRALAMGLLAAMLASVLAWMAARRLSEDLQTLSQAAGTVAIERHQGHIPRLNSSVEVEQLSIALRNMTDHLVAAHDAMETQVSERTAQLESANRELDRQARSDPLTGLLNRRGFDLQLQFTLALARRSNRPVSMVVIDVDHFKRINDQHGHDIGDQVLQRLAAIMRARVRESDAVARLGGEEFAILLPDTTLEGARAMAQELVHSMADHPDPVAGCITVSAGVSTLRGAHDTESALLRRGDMALYTAKEQGRNRVCVQA